MNRVVEILQYTLHQGSGADFHTMMREISVPLHRQHGIDVVAFANSLHDADSYCLIRAFDNLQHMAHVLDTFYASDDWRLGPRQEIINRIEVSLKTVLSLPSVSINALRQK